tara:strand:- start:546 stop:785 length:240 start_codon:yes stop_codon:yes gene_type:complete
MGSTIFQTSCEKTKSSVLLKLDDETGESKGIRCPHYDSEIGENSRCDIYYKGRDPPAPLPRSTYWRGPCIILETKMMEV